MSKCIEIAGYNPGESGNGRMFDYKCPICGHITPTLEGCNSHLYKKHRKVASKDS
ncbi:MAG: hypothetical protein M0Z77_08700 [Thermoplasmatales archaeon]|nr:hypothetical protein [Thermoplasmatales archaeon]